MIDILSYKLGQKAGGGSGGSISLQDKTIAENGEYTADAGYDGLGKVTVDVAGSGGIAAGISYDEFNEYNGLTKATVYGSVILANAFKGQGNLADVVLPNELTQIKNDAFNACYDLALTALPEGLKEIGANAFTRCSKLTLMSLPAGIKSILMHTFSYCAELALTSLPSATEMLANYALYSCPKLALTSLPASLTSIGECAFGSCTGLTSITFEGTPTYLAYNAFQGCTNLTTINVPWAEGEVKSAPWGATNATINYNYTGA